MRLRRRNTAWLAILGAMIGLVALSGAASASVTALLIGLFLVAAAASIIEIRPRRVLRDAPRSPLALMRMSPQAREAYERARRRGSYIPAGLTLLDVGLISQESGSEGMVMRRTRSVSLDDDGVRPYITLNVAPEEADRNSVIRFEILDQNGQTQYVHEMKAFMRDGEMNILADHHLPLAGNPRVTGGDWDLRVSVDGAVIGLLAFTATPSLRDRQRQITRDVDGAALRLSDREDEEDAPATLEDLLRSRSRNERR
jgi:hypothetical protein